MTKNDFKTFAGLMAMLDETFGKESSKLKINVYFDGLKDFDIETVQKSIFFGIKTLKFYPCIAELREIIEGDSGSQSLLAWQEAIRGIQQNFGGTYSSIQFDDPLIHWVIERMGGWQNFGRWTEKEEPFIQKDFERLYKIAMRIPKDQLPQTLIGFHERNNTSGGHYHISQQTVDFHSLLPSRETKRLETDKKKELKN